MEKLNKYWGVPQEEEKKQILAAKTVDLERNAQRAILDAEAEVASAKANLVAFVRAQSKNREPDFKGIVEFQKLVESAEAQLQSTSTIKEQLFGK